VSHRFRRVAYERSWFKITCLELDESYRGEVAHKLDLQLLHFCKQNLQDNAIKEILKRANGTVSLSNPSDRSALFYPHFPFVLIFLYFTGRRLDIQRMPAT